MCSIEIKMIAHCVGKEMTAGCARAFLACIL